MSDENKCREGHKWDGIFPVIDPKKLEPQYPQLWGKVCDCGRMKILGEAVCGCVDPRWEVQIVAT